MIHSTAIIHKNSKIGKNVKIGAYSVIDEYVTIEDDCYIGNHVNITGDTYIGRSNKIYHFSSIGEVPQDKKYNNELTKLIIGENNTIREYCSINIGTVHGIGKTVIGNENWIMAYSHIAHDCIIGNYTVLANSVTFGGHVIVKDYVIIGGHSAVHQFCVIGEHVMVGGGSAIAQDIPPYVVTSGHRAGPNGINVEGLSRKNFTNEQISNIKKAYRILYKNNMPYNDAKISITSLSAECDELKVFVEFFAQSQRGIIR